MRKFCDIICDVTTFKENFRGQIAILAPREVKCFKGGSVPWISMLKVGISHTVEFKVVFKTMQSTQYQNICFVSLGSFAKSQSQRIPGVWVLLTDPSMSDIQKYQNVSLSQPSQRGRYRAGLKPNGRFQQTLANQFLFPFSLMMQKLYFYFLIFWDIIIDSIKVLPHWLLVWNKWTKRMRQSVKTTGTVSGKRMCSIITNCFDIAASLTIWLVSKGRQADGELGSHINNRTRSELMLRHNRRTIIGRSW